MSVATGKRGGSKKFWKPTNKETSLTLMKWDCLTKHSLLRLSLTRGETYAGGKRSEQRNVVLAGANTDGSEKLNMVVVGKSKQSHCFKGVPKLPVMYHVNGKAWMTQAMFETWLWQ